jgi:hypothetical protein
LEIVKEKQPELVDEVDFYIVGCRHNQTANLLWRYVDYTPVFFASNRSHALLTIFSLAWSPLAMVLETSLATPTEA